jgi:outer membrane biosynthesis protein TonB
MTTADMMLTTASPSSGAFARPGTRTLDHEYDARTVFLALLAAIFIHFAVACLLASLSGVFSPTIPFDEKPAELTLVDLSSAQPVSKNPAFIETDESKQSVEAPKEKTFESNANSIAASELPAGGDAALPSQEGKDRPLVDLETHPYSPEMNGPQPQPSAVPQENPNASASPQTQPGPVTAAEQFAMLTARPTPALKPSAAAQAQSAYRPWKERTHISGKITNRGISSVNALGTPLGRYEKILKDAVGSRWYAYVDQKRDLINIGTLRLRFYIDRSGQVKALKITENSSNEAFANVCLQSVLEAHLPPIPEDVANTLPSEGLEVDGFTFTIYPN